MPGALSAAFSKLATPITGQINPVAGTSVSAVIGAGKFANGAVTGAFSYVFNYLSHSPAAKGYLDQLRAGSPLAAQMLDALAADKSVTYRFDIERLPESAGGGTVRTGTGKVPVKVLDIVPLKSPPPTGS